MTITEKQASEWLKKSVDLHCSKNVNKFDHIYHWTQNEFDAMVSFAYNIGSIDGLCAKGKRSKSQIANEMLKYVKAKGKVLPGLVKRRNMEKQLFVSKGKSIIQKIFKNNILNKIGREIINDEWDNI